MKFGAFFVLAGSLALAGCSSTASGNTPTPTSPPATKTGSDPTAAPASTRHTGTPLAAPTVSSAGAASPYDRGKSYLAQGNYHAAETEFKAAISQGQHGASSYDGLGTAATELGDYMSAYHAFKTAAQMDPQNPGYVYRAAYTALYANDFRSSMTYATRYIQMRPRDVNGYHLRLLADGKLLLRPNQLADAEAIVRLQPHNADAYNDLGIALGNDGKNRQSEAAFTRAITLSPKVDQYYTNRAIVENLDKKPGLALQDLYRARSVATNPKTITQINLAIKNLKKSMKG